MNPAAYALEKSTVVVVMTLMLAGAGIVAYQNLGQLEDPTFTIKTALVITPYPGASPKEVEEEVTDVIEEAIQAMDQVKEIYSTSQEGNSFVFVDMKDTYHHQELPQIWDELRRKVSDVQGQLPPGAVPSIVNDDFGDVFGVFFALTGEGYSYAELKDYAESLKNELLLCDNVAKIELWGTRQEVIYVEIKRARMTELGLSPQRIAQILQSQNMVAQSGKVEIDGNYMRITPTGDFTSESLIADLLIGGANGLVRLGDVAEIRRGYEEPPRSIMRFNGQPAIGMGISTTDGGNVVTMGESIKRKLEELAPNRPPGIMVNTVYYQSEIVTESVDIFVMNLVQAVAIVIVLLMLFMGWRSGLLIGVILLLTILATFVAMLLLDIDLQKISLGALVLALGMLVDNAIVVADGVLVRVERGEDRRQAAIDTVRDTSWPLLGATLVAILAFTAIGFAPGNVGEFCRSLFYVMMASLLISWLLAVTVTPLFCVWFLKTSDKQGQVDPYDRSMYRVYRRFLHRAIRFRWITVALTIGLLVVAVAGFEHVPKAFFPDSTQSRFYINYWIPQGAHIDRTSDDLKQIEQFVRKLDDVTGVSTFVGEGTLRIMLSYDYESPNNSYGQILVDVDDYREIDRLIDEVDGYLRENFPDSEPYCNKVPNGPPVTMKIEVRFRGADQEVLRELANRAMEIMRDTPDARDIRTDWRQPTRVIRPFFSESQARRVGVGRNDLAQSLQWNFNGIVTGLYREGDEQLPIVSRPPKIEHRSAENLQNVQVWSTLHNTFVPIRQVVTEIEAVWEESLIQRRQRQRTITVQCNPEQGLADPLRNAMVDRMEAISLPLGYSMEWGGEYKDSQEGQEPIRKTFPICLLAMFVIVVWLFNSVRRPLIVFLVVPLSIIGVTAGLIVTGIPFGFMAILGFLGLSGMLIKNAIVLIDQIEIDLREGKPPYQAILDSAVSRMRPVIMASGTTILGMMPLVTDPLYSAMAATIMSGLFAATFLTLIVVPILYSLFFRIRPDNKHA